MKIRAIERGRPALKYWLILLVGISGLLPLPVSADGGVNLDRLIADFELALEEIVEDSGAPGAVAAFVLPDGRMHRVAVGFADVESRQPMETGSRMLSGSVGKSFVGALSLKLARQGVLDLDAPISTWLGERPWFRQLRGGSLMTLRQLLRHRSGVIDHVHAPEFNEAFASGQLDLATGVTPEQLVSFVLDKEPLFTPGSGYAYSDTGFLLIGLIIEQATGNAYYAELGKHFLEPLRLDDTSPSNRRQLAGLVPGYLENDNLGQGLKTMKKPGELFYNPATEWTGGGLVTNAGDLARWAKLLYEGKVMEGEYLSELLCSKPLVEANKYSTYGLGQGISQTGHGIVYGHSGWIPGYVSFMAYFPDYRVAVAAQFNTTRGYGSETSPITLAKERLVAVLIDALE